MSVGIKLQNFIEDLRAVDFPVHLVPGGDIHLIFSKNLPFVDAIYELRLAVLRRQKLKEANRRPINKVRT